MAQKIHFAGNGTKSLHLSVKASLQKLRTDYIDILYCHWYDWDTSVEELMNSLHNLVVSGKVLYLVRRDFHYIPRCSVVNLPSPGNISKYTCNCSACARYRKDVELIMWNRTRLHGSSPKRTSTRLTMARHHFASIRASGASPSAPSNARSFPWRAI